MPKRTVKSVKASCDRLWALLVKARAGGKCERCGQVGRLEAHHAYGRANHRLRFERRNGVALCFQCHVWAEGFPILFTEWFHENRAHDAEFLRDEHAKGTVKPRRLSDYIALETELADALEQATDWWAA